MKRVGLVPAVLVLVAATSLVRRSSAALALPLLEQDPAGKTVYLANCKQCHGVLGQPTKAAERKYDHIASFTDGPFFDKRTEDSIVTVLKNGKGRDMKSFKDKLSDAEMHAVAQYIRTLVKPKG